MTKTLTVPAGYQGVALGAQARVYPAGEHRVVTFWQRLFGKLSDRRWALLPATPFALRAPIPRLKAGDDAWVDVNATFTLRVEAPVRAAVACPSTLAELATALSTALEPTARQTVSGWAAADLGQPEVNGRLAAQLRPVLEAQAQTLGLIVERLLAVVARPSEEALEAARQRDALEMEKQIDALSTRAEWLDFIRNFKGDFGLTTATLDALLADMDEGAFDAARLRQAVSASFAGEEAALAVRAQRILGQPQPLAPLPPPRWEPAILWFKLAAGAILFLGLALYAIAPLIALEQAETLLLIAAPTALVLFGAAFWAERQSAIRTTVVSRPLLERLGKGDRQRMDRIVREQLVRELQALATKINDARTFAYREGHREKALQLKSVQERADRARQDVSAERHGMAAYLAEAKITRRQLATMLAYDESLLAQSAALGDAGEIMRQQALSENLTDQAVKDLEIALSNLDHQIQARARFIQAPSG